MPARMPPEALLRDLLADKAPSTRDDSLANELLTAFHRGYPVEHLRPLLHSSQYRTVSAGVWIASELGEKGRALLDDVVPLLRHPLKDVRFHALDCVLVWASATAGSALGSAVSLLDDSEEAVRWKAMSVLWRASGEQLASALAHMSKEGCAPVCVGLRWLLSLEATDADAVAASLRSEDPIRRRCAVVAAARIAPESPGPLLLARSLDDKEVREFSVTVARQLGERFLS